MPAVCFRFIGPKTNDGPPANIRAEAHTHCFTCSGLPAASALCEARAPAIECSLHFLENRKIHSHLICTLCVVQLTLVLHHTQSQPMRLVSHAVDILHLPTPRPKNAKRGKSPCFGSALDAGDALDSTCMCTALTFQLSFIVRIVCRSTHLLPLVAKTSASHPFTIYVITVRGTVGERYATCSPSLSSKQTIGEKKPASRLIEATR